MTREEPSLEMLWFKNKETMEKDQILKNNNTAPSSKTFRGELTHFVSASPQKQRRKER
jgi:hypothetical protein